MKFEETGDGGSSAFGAYPFDLSAVCLDAKKPAQWRPVSRFMAPAPGPSERENRALVPSSPSSGGKRSRPNWPPSIRREEANVLNSLKKRMGYCRVRNTSTFKNISGLVSSDEKPTDDGENESEKNVDPQESANKTLLRKMLSNRSFNRLSNHRDTDTDWYTSDFVVECLCWHNVYRQRHRSPPLTLSPELCHFAQEWANTLAHTNLFYYRPNVRDVGQNIYCRLNVKDPGDVTGQEVAGFWYGACKKYDFLKRPEILHANPNAGHFTQLVWAGSRDIGIGIARTKSGKVMVVANYRPRGNVTGQFEKNVFLPALECKTADCTDCCTFPIPR